VLNRDKLSDKKNSTDEDILRLFTVYKMYFCKLYFSIINSVRTGGLGYGC